MKRIAVVLFNLGGPDSLEAVEPFLRNLFSDPYIISIPLGFIFQKPLARIIARKRSEFVQQEYGQVGGCSPINEWTEKQRRTLEQSLRNVGHNVDVYTGMRYWHPLIEDTACGIERGGYDRIILLPLFPHYSKTTTGSSFAEWRRVYRGDPDIVTYVNDYPEHPSYIAAINERIDEAVRRFPEPDRDKVEIIFSAHGTPVSLYKKGDPYKGQIDRTIAAVMRERNHDFNSYISYQSKVGPVKWLEPATSAMIAEVGRRGTKHLLVVPISFVSDHVETLYELDIEHRRIADEAGIENYVVMRGLNDSARFVQALTEIVVNRLNKDTGT